MGALYRVSRPSIHHSVRSATEMTIRRLTAFPAACRTDTRGAAGERRLAGDARVRVADAARVSDGAEAVSVRPEAESPGVDAVSRVCAAPGMSLHTRRAKNSRQAWRLIDRIRGTAFQIIDCGATLCSAALCTVVRLIRFLPDLHGSAGCRGRRPGCALPCSGGVLHLLLLHLLQRCSCSATLRPRQMLTACSSSVLSHVQASPQRGL